MAELKLTNMAAELAPPPKPRAAFKPRGLANRKRTQVPEEHVTIQTSHVQSACHAPVISQLCFTSTCLLHATFKSNVSFPTRRVLARRMQTGLNIRFFGCHRHGVVLVMEWSSSCAVRWYQPDLGLRAILSRLTCRDGRAFVSAAWRQTAA